MASGEQEQIETERKEGRETWDAVLQGTLSRFRPIMLTAISTVRFYFLR